MAWIESHQTLAGHPKLIRLSKMLKIHKAQAIGHLHMLWWWALDYAPDGDLTPLSPAEVGAAAQWPRGEEAFYRALTECGWIDGDGHLHDWSHYAGQWLLAKDRQKRYRLKRHLQRNGDVSPADPHNVTVTTTLPNLTQPNPTQPNLIKDKRFQRPTLLDIQDFLKDFPFPGFDPQQFLDFYESKGWRVGNSPMKNWQASIRTWKKRGGQNIGRTLPTETKVGQAGGFISTKQPLF